MSSTFENKSGNKFHYTAEATRMSNISKRDAPDEQICNGLEIAAKGTETAGNVAADIASIPVMDKRAAAGFAVFAGVNHLASGGIEIASIIYDCESIPFEEIKEILEEKFSEQDRKLDRNYAVMQNIPDLVNKTLSSVETTRKEMHEGLKDVLESIKNSRVEPVVSKIKNFVQYFERERESMKTLPKDDYVSKLQEEHNVLIYLQDSSTPKEDSLQSLLYQIVDQKYAIPENRDDKVALSALFALYYGIQTYVSVLAFLLDHYSYLADYHYQDGNLEEYNRCFDAIKNRFRDFKSSLVDVGNRDNRSLIDSVIDVLTAVRNKHFMSGKYQLLTNRIETLKNLKNQLTEMVLPILKDTPKYSAIVNFDGPELKAPIGEWNEAKYVSYAIQYRSIDTFSKIGKWSQPAVSVGGKSSPLLKIPVDRQGRTRLIFRKFDDGKPLLIGVLSDPHQTDLRDVNRDLYDSAENGITVEEFTDLMSLGADPNTVFEKGRRALHAAAQNGDTELALLLLEKTEIDVKDANGYTATHVAAEAGQDRFVSFMMQHGADVNAKTNEEELTPLHLAVGSGFADIVETLIESNQIKINEGDRNGFSPLHYAVTAGRPVLEALLSSGSINVNVQSKSGLTPLHLAAISGNSEAVETLLYAFLLTADIEVNLKDQKGLTALHMAASAGNLDIVQFLIFKEGTDVNAKSLGNQWSPLHYAIFFKRENVALVLARNEKVDVDLMAEDNITPLHMAVATGQKKIVTALLEKANVRSETKKKLTALHIAAMRGNEDIFYLLLARGLSFTAETIDGETPLHFAAGSGSKGIVFNLLVREVDDKALDKNNEAPAHKAARNGKIETLKALIEHDPRSINILNKNLETPLILAVEQNHLEIVLYLCSLGAGINLSTTAGNTALHVAAKNNNPRIFKALINAGGHLHIKNKAEETPEDVAKNNDAEDVLSYLQSRKSRKVEYDIESPSKQIEEFASQHEKLSSNADNYKKIYYDSSAIELFHPANAFPRMTRATGNRDVDFVGTLLLLDVLLRKCTGQEYIRSPNEPETVLDVKARALDITISFEEFLNCVGNMAADEVIDLTEVNSKIFKSLMSGRSGKISEILCPYVKEVSQLDSEKVKELLAVFMNNFQFIPSDVSYSGDEIKEHLQQLAKKICSGNNESN